MIVSDIYFNVWSIWWRLTFEQDTLHPGMRFTKLNYHSFIFYIDSFHWKSANLKLRNSSTSVWWISSLPVALKPVKTSYSNITFFSDWVDCGHWHRRNHHHQAERLGHWHGKFFIKLEHRLSAFKKSIFVILNGIFQVGNFV